MRGIDQTLIHSALVRGGVALVNYRVAEWLKSGQCAFRSGAASGLIADLQAMEEWSTTEIYLRPFYLNEGLGGPDPDVDRELFLRLAEHFRAAALPQQGAEWADGLPRLPLTTAESKDLIQERVERDEIRAMGRLVGLGSLSATIVMCLGLTRSVIKEALAQLSHDRHLQVTLRSILGATRFKILVRGRVYHVECPHTMLYMQDSFGHLLECFPLQQDVQFGADAAPFLVQMARRAATVLGRPRIPYTERVRAEEGGEPRRKREGGD